MAFLQNKDINLVCMTRGHINVKLHMRRPRVYLVQAKVNQSIIKAKMEKIGFPRTSSRHLNCIWSEAFYSKVGQVQMKTCLY